MEAANTPWKPLMISVELALEKVLSQVNILDSQLTPILDCLGQVLAEEVVSEIDIPPRDNSAMDGYAVKALDTKGASRKSPKYFTDLSPLIYNVPPFLT